MTFSAASQQDLTSVHVWSVGALCSAVADTLAARFNPVVVAGELSGVSQAASGHLYFSVKDDTGQLRCAMFRRSAQLLDFKPRDGQQVELRGRLAVYEPRGDLQLVVESMRQSGQGRLFEQFLQLKARLQAQGLFDVARKRVPPQSPRAIGLVTSLGAAALHDVLSALQRRAPHVPIYLAAAPVQGQGAPQALVAALKALYAIKHEMTAPSPDVILLVRGGGSLEDLWAFNDEDLARCIVQSPVPIISGVGHETDFTIADFCADLRAPTPTAAAELAARPMADWRLASRVQGQRLHEAFTQVLDRHAQRLDQLQARLGRPSQRMTQSRLALQSLAHRLRHASHMAMIEQQRQLQHLATRSQTGLRSSVVLQSQRLQRAALRLPLLDPHLVLGRGYAWLSDEQGNTVLKASQVVAGQGLKAVLAEGAVDVTVRSA